MPPYNTFYPNEWPAISREIKELCDYTCQGCGKKCRRPGEFYLGWHYQLTIAHLTQDYEADAVTVCALCLPCHLHHDAPLAWVARRRWQRVRLRLAGQLEMFSAS